MTFKFVKMARIRSSLSKTKTKTKTMISSSSCIIRHPLQFHTSSSSLPSFHSLSSPARSVFSLQPDFRIPDSSKPISFKGITHPCHRILMDKRSFFSTNASLSNSPNGSHVSSSSQGSESFLRSVLQSMETVYLDRNPTAKKILELVHSAGNERICYDHFAFRTFGVNGHGIDSMAEVFLDFGYRQKDELRFPAKKLKAYWFSPPDVSSEKGSGINGPLPRVFISELLVDQMSSEAQEIIKKYTGLSGNGKRYAALASSQGSLTWDKPSHSEFQRLARESEYAAWTLVNGYALNHVTISTHRLSSHLKNIKRLNQFIEDSGFKLNSEGDTLKVSPDGFLLQSSTVADSMHFQFSDGTKESVPCSYIEFAERLVLPEYKHLPDEEIKEFHRRDGFEVGNADKIFESTSMEQLTRKAT